MMLHRFSTYRVPVSLIILVLFMATPRETMAKKKDKHYKDQYSLDLTALKGPNETELKITVLTRDPLKYPVPEELEKLKVKIVGERPPKGKDDEKEKGHLINERHLELIDNQIVRYLSEAPLHVTLKVEAEIRIGKKKVKIKEDVEVTLRPDLIVDNVSYPLTVSVDQPFSITAHLQEILGDNGATANVNLNTDELTMITPEVFIAPGVATTVIFTGLSLDTLGLFSFIVDISDAIPGEYDVSNNSFSFDVEVIPPKTPGVTDYFMYYANFNNRLAGYGSDICGNIDETEVSGDYDEFYLQGSSVEATPGGSLDISFRLYADGISAYTLDLEGLDPYQTVNEFEYYEYIDEAVGIFITYESKPGDAAYFEINKLSGQNIYVNRLNNITTNYTEDYGPHMDAETSIETSVRFDDGFTLIGGSASMNLQLPEIVNDVSTTVIPNDSCGVDLYFNYEMYELIIGFADGIMSPTFLTKRSQPAVAESLLPESIYLTENYPNPFNPRTAISFGLPEDAKVRMIVYDISGREVVRLADGRFPAGKHNLYLDASELSSGTYFYSLEAGSFKEVKRMLLLK